MTSPRKAQTHGLGAIIKVGSLLKTQEDASLKRKFCIYTDF